MAKWQRGLIGIVAVTVTSVFFIDFCNLVYQCGCTSLWAGAAAHCNVHHGPKHCPWCSIGQAGYLAVWLGMVIPQGLVSFWPAHWRWPLRLTLALLIFPLAGIIMAVPLGIWQGYWN